MKKYRGGPRYEKVTLVVLFAVLLASVAFAKNTLPVAKVAGVQSYGSPGSSAVIWDNFAESGYEFLMGYEIGIGHSLVTPNITCGPLITKPPLVGGNGDTMTEDAFDIIDSAGNCVGSYWFGSSENPCCSKMNHMAREADKPLSRDAPFIAEHRAVGYEESQGELMMFLEID